MPHVNRIVIGVNDDRQSAVILRDSPNHQEVPGVFWRSTLWATTELPVNNQISGDRAAEVTAREPAENGLIFRALEIPPDSKDSKKHIETLQELHRQVKQKYPPTEKDLERHPSMHRTDTCDLFVIAYGEVYLVTDTDETLLRAGDTAIVKGVNHAWSNTSDKPCLIIGVMVHAHPWPKDQYPAEGL